MRCPNCGHENNDSATHCENCGQEIPHYDYSKEALINLKRIRRLRFNITSNRILLIVSFITLVLLFVSIFLPTLSLKTTSGTIEYGGLAWFSKIGWDALNHGEIAVGPFMVTFILYLLNMAATITFGVLALTSIIKSLREKKGFKATQYMILIFVSNIIYISSILNYYYEYYAISNAYYETSQAPGYFIFELARVLFLIPFMVHIVFNGIFHEDKMCKIKIIMISILSYFLLGAYADYFTSTGFSDYTLRETYIYGLGKYLDPSAITHAIPEQGALAIIICFIFALLALLSVIGTFIYVIHEIYKKDNIDTFHLLFFAGAQFISIFGLIITSIIVGECVNLVPEISNVHIDINFSLLLLGFYASALLAASIVLFIIDYKSRNKYNNGIIDNKID